MHERHTRDPALNRFLDPLGRSRPLMLAAHYLAEGKELVHRQTRLLCMLGVRPIIAAAITPPHQSTVIKSRLTRIHYRAAFGQGRMAVNRVHECLAMGGSHKNVLQIWHHHSVLTVSVRTITVKKGFELQNLVAIDGNCSGGVEIGIGLWCHWGPQSPESSPAKGSLDRRLNSKDCSGKSGAAIAPLRSLKQLILPDLANEHAIVLYWPSGRKR